MPRHDDLIQAYLTHLELRGCSPRTVRSYRLTLTRAQRDLPYGVANASLDEMEAWLLGDTAWTPATRHSYRAAFVGFFRWAVRAGHLDHDTAAALPEIKLPFRLPRPPADEQVVRIVTGLTGPALTWVMLAAYAGLRCIEVWRLDRLDITQRAVRVHGKGSKDRVIPTHPALWAAVEALPPGRVAAVPQPDDVSERAAAAIRRLCYDRWQPRVTMRHLRAWFATQALAATGDLRAVQQLLGHASPTTTARFYAVALPDALAAAVAGVPAVTAAGGPGAPRGAVPAP